MKLQGIYLLQFTGNEATTILQSTGDGNTTKYRQRLPHGFTTWVLRCIESCIVSADVSRYCM